MKNKSYPSLYQINTRTFLHKLSEETSKKATLEDISDSFLDEIRKKGFDWIYFLGVWQTGATGREISQNTPQWRQEFQEALPDLTQKDITGSCFAIKTYSVHRDFGGNKALAALRKRMASKGLRLMLDFVPNHTGIDHPWVKSNPGYYITGNEKLLEEEPDNYIHLLADREEVIFAHGRDPNFPGWPDTLQLDYGSTTLQRVMTGELVKVAGLCDGVRCDMAMLLLPDVFIKTWGKYINPFWPGAIETVKYKYPQFTFMAEVYWNMEWELMQQGFDYCYDKRLYDRLAGKATSAVRDHLRADLNFQDRLVRFLENHDEKRAATVFPIPMEPAAAIGTYFLPGLRFFQRGQELGYRVKVPVHLARGPEEKIDNKLALFYDRLFNALKQSIFRQGQWRVLDPCPSWHDNYSYQNFIAYWWTTNRGEKSVVAINYSDKQSQCFLRLPSPDLAGKQWKLKDAIGDHEYERDGNDLLTNGLFLDLAGWAYHVFILEKKKD